MTVQALLDRLDNVRSRGTGRYKAKCPAHLDKTPSFSIRETEDRLLFHCFGGCQPEEIVAALGLELKDLFKDVPHRHRQQSPLKPQKLDLFALAYKFELAALDRRLRADAVLQAVGHFTSDGLSQSQHDRLMKAVAHAFEDRDRAEFLEAVADDLRWKAFEEGRRVHA